jgi:two-component system sensor histidine kinase RpfC
VIIQAIVVIWSGGWLFGPQPVLVRDAQAVFPVAVGLLVFALGWMVLVRKRVIPAANWLDAAGFAMNLLFIGIQIKLAFILLIPLNAFLPFITIAAVARYGKRAIRPVLIATFVLLIVTAPSGYWLSRPAYFLYAVALTIVLPLMVARMVTAMQEVAFQALASRDAQSRFISTMSHELRTPLNALINCSQLIETDRMPAAQQELMNAVAVNAMALRHRVNEVLDVASIDGGGLDLRLRSCSLQNILETVRAVTAPAAAAKGVSLTFRLDAPETVFLVGDEGRIEQVITNLVTNAIKFTPSGGLVDLLIEARLQASDWRVSITVTDTGIGIPDEKKEAIFSPFLQLSSGSNRTEGGVGLGLYVARSVSELMNGNLTIRDNPSGGSIFNWTFTAKAAADSGISVNLKQLLATHREAVKPIHCLVFEDLDTNRLVIGNLLERAGHRVTFYNDGFDAVARIRDAQPHIVFLDLHMPEKSGWSVLRDIKPEIDSLPPIVVLTADMRTESIRGALELGVAGYLPKPINAHELLNAIQRNALRNA